MLGGQHSRIEFECTALCNNWGAILNILRAVFSLALFQKNYWKRVLNVWEKYEVDQSL